MGSIGATVSVKCIEPMQPALATCKLGILISESNATTTKGKRTPGQRDVERDGERRRERRRETERDGERRRETERERESFDPRRTRADTYVYIYI